VNSSPRRRRESTPSKCPLYVANSTDDGVTVYGPHESEPKRELFRGISTPESLYALSKKVTIFSPPQ
jgi:hypothetical protein